MNKAQANYTNAKKVFEAALAAKRSHMEQYDAMLDNNDDDFEQYTILEMEAHEQFNIDELKAKLVAAEEALILWTINKVEQTVGGLVGEEANAALIVLKNRNQPKVRAQLIAASMSFAG